MALINVTNVVVYNNPARFTDPFKFEITFECIPPGVKEELEWKMIYVGSADEEKYDQELESVLVGPVNVGKNKFTFEAPAPDPGKIPEKDLLEITVLLLTCSYREKEFIRVGYYVNTDYGPDQSLALNPPMKPLPDKLWRNLLADKPRVTRFQIGWDDPDGGLFGMMNQNSKDGMKIGGGKGEAKEGPPAGGGAVNDITNASKPAGMAGVVGGSAGPLEHQQQHGRPGGGMDMTGD